MPWWTWQVAYCRADRAVLTVTQPPCVAWSEAAHPEFPASFRVAAAAFLLCLNRLSLPYPEAHCVGTAYGRCLPNALVRMHIAVLTAPSPAVALHLVR